MFQHYLKVHRVKEFECESCHKKFFTLKDKTNHQVVECGKKFICSICNFTYDNKLSLFTHAKRKNHMQNQPDDR